MAGKSGPELEAEYELELARLRREIDAADRRIVELLNLRSGLSLSVGRLKKERGRAVNDPDREAALMEKLLRLNREMNGSLPESGLAEIYRAIISSSRSLQEKFMEGSGR